MSFTFSNKNNVFFIVVAAISVFDLAIFFYLPLLSSIRQELRAN
ncbi:hypothetical protein [Candidatus Aquarickettsia rohweri]|nr:hypothetical protein [Candidatus Aquarickettsia rohweri]